MSNIIIRNDGKENHQSWEATLVKSGGDGKGYCNINVEGWGANEHEAKSNLIQQVDNLIKNLKRIKNEI
jgi:hypothetical protein